MEINRIGAANDPSFSLVERARQLAEQYQSARLQDQEVRTGITAPNVTASKAFAPAVYAQAAQYQLYTQSGALAAIGGSANAHTPPKSHGPPNAIQAVESAQGSRVDTRA